LLEKIESLKKEVKDTQVADKSQLESFRIKFISRKGVMTRLFDDFKQVPNQEKRMVGQALNELKDLAQSRFKSLASEIEDKTGSLMKSGFDLSLPPVQNTVGSVHPLTSVKHQIIKIFERIGFNVSEGPEIEDDWHNFSALNFPENHPAREMQDTFFIKKNPDIALRTHTSSVQVRVMENTKPPIRTLSPGRVPPGGRILCG
jgi:phenylalanyl-tRNA synthetase alpha chain